MAKVYAKDFNDFRRDIYLNSINDDETEAANKMFDILPSDVYNSEKYTSNELQLPSEKQERS